MLLNGWGLGNTDGNLGGTNLINGGAVVVGIGNLDSICAADGDVFSPWKMLGGGDNELLDCFVTPSGLLDEFGGSSHLSFPDDFSCFRHFARLF